LLSNIAQLKTYKISKSKFNKAENQTTKTVTNLSIRNKIIINDSIVYTRSEQFKSTEALHVYNESLLMMSELSDLETSLAGLRANYDAEELNDKKNSLSEQIKILEPQILKLKKAIVHKSLLATNTESLFLFPK
jgi:hypothetical protein